MVDSARAKPALGNLETSSFSKQNVGGGDANVHEANLGVPVRGVIVSKYGQHAHNFHARRIHRHQNHRLLLMHWSGRIGLAHKNSDPASWIPTARGPPLMPVQYVFVPLPDNAGFDVGCVRGCDGRLRHRKARTDFTMQEWFQPSLLLFARAIPSEDLHIAGVGRRAIEDFRSHETAAHDLA